jgi:RNA-binding protein Musashi
MVEVKRAVPKELSPGPTRSPLGGFNNNTGLGRVNNLLNGFNQAGYNANSVGGYGIRMDGRFSPVNVARSGYSPFGPGYGVGLNFDPLMSPNYSGSANLGLNLGYGQLSPSYGGNSSRFISSIGQNGSVMSSPSRNLWGNANLDYDGSNSLKSNGFISSGNGNSGMGSLGNIGALWGSSGNSVQGGGNSTSPYGNSLNLGGGDFTVGSGYGRNNATAIPQASSHTSLNGGFDGTYGDIYDSNSFYGDSAWRSSPSERKDSGPFSFGIGSVTSDAVTRNSAGLPGYVDGYSVTNRQSSRGIAA